MGGQSRSYECVFCKRGFTTAQALGGHMNIHRKDRTKTKPSGSSSSTITTRHEDPYRPARAYYPTTWHPTYYSAPAEESFAFQAFYPVTSLEDYRRSDLSLRIGIGSGFNPASKLRGDDDELDLELRLGHYCR